MAISFGSLSFSLSAVTTGLTAGIASLRAFATAAMASATAASGAATATTGAIGSLQNMAHAAALVTGPLSGIASRLNLLGTVLRSTQAELALFVAGAAGGVYAILKFSESAVATEKTLVRMRLGLTALTGSLPAAVENMRFLMDISDKFGIKFEEVADHFTRFEMSARGTKLEGTGIRNMFQDIVAVGGNLAMSNEKLTQTMEALERVLGRGRLGWRELNQLLGTLIPNAANLAAEALGKTRAELELNIRHGDIITDTFLPKFVAAMKKAYGVDSKLAVDSLLASENRLHNAHIRFNDSMNQTLGFSASWKSGAEGLTRVLDFLSANMRQVVQIAGAVGGALLGIASYAVIGGFLSMAIAVGRVGVALSTLNFIAARSPLALLARLALAIGGAALADKFLNEQLEKNQGLQLGQLASTEKFIKSLETAKNVSAATIQSYLEQARQEEELTRIRLYDAQKLQQALEIEAKLAAARTTMTGVHSDEAEKATSNLQAQQRVVQQLKETYDRAVGSVGKLTIEFAKQEKVERDQQGIQMALTQWQENYKAKVSELTRHLTEANIQWVAMTKGPEELRKAVELREIWEPIEHLRDELTKSTMMTKEMIKLFDDWAKSSIRLKQAQQFDKDYVTVWKAMADAVSEFGKRFADEVITKLNEGKLTMKDFGKLAVTVLAEVEKKILELAVINPLIKQLFGTQVPTLTFTQGGTAMGGLFGSLLTSIGLGTPGTTPAATKHSGSASHTFRSVPWSTFSGAPRLHSGMSADEFPAILQRGEEVIPRGGSNREPVIHIHNYHDSAQVSARRRGGASGGANVFDIVISAVTKGLADGSFDASLRNWNTRQHGALR